MKLKERNYFFSDAQIKNEISKCEYCEEKGCTAKCPANCSPMDFIRAAETGEKSDYKRAAGLIYQYNVFGGVCGMVCPDKHCMSGCSHKEFDSSLNIPDIQSTIIEKAYQLNAVPQFEKSKSNNKKIAVIGAGPSGIAAGAVLSQLGYTVKIYEKEKKSGGACNLIPDFRLPKNVLERDINFAASLGRINIKCGKKIKNAESILSKGFDAVIVAAGLQKPFKLGIPNEKLAVSAFDYLRNSENYPMTDEIVAVVGGGATAADCALTAKLKGAKRVEMFALETLSEMPLTSKEMKEIVENGISVEGRIKVVQIIKKDGKISGIKTKKVSLKDGAKFNLRDLSEVEKTEVKREDITKVIIAIGASGDFPKSENNKIFYCGDFANGPTTVVEAVASGKNIAAIVDASVMNTTVADIKDFKKSFVVIKGFNSIPVSLETKFFGKKISTPFLLSAAPPSDGYEQMRKAYQTGWSGGVMKTAFDNVPIHIPSEYMFAFDKKTFANCDNVSGHTLDSVCREIEKLRKEFPDKLTIGGTGGPVTGHDENDKPGWQSNTKKLENAGAMAVEYSLSCPQGGDGTEGDIVSQNAELTAKIIDWILEAGEAEVPKLFKLTAAVTSIEAIIKAIKKVLKKYPNKKAGVTLANTFPTLAFRWGAKKEWEDGIIVGMSGAGVVPISFLTLAKAAPLGVEISGNGGPMNYKNAAHFLALGVKTVQFCTMIMKYGYNVFGDLCSGISHLMEDRGIKSMNELIGIALPHPVIDFMALESKKKISDVNKELCEHCGNCSRCSYLAITYDENKIPVTDASKCIGCSICVQKCFAGALYMRERTEEELESLRVKEISRANL